MSAMRRDPADARPIPRLLAPELLVPAAELAPARGLVRVLDDRAGGERWPEPSLTPARLRELYRAMLRSRVLDERLMRLRLQGRIGAYADARGQEAAVLGAAFALDPGDWIFPAQREMGALLARGLPLGTYLAQLFGSAHDLLKGRQTPCHAGSREHAFLPGSSPVGTQLPHATGAAWAAKLRGDPTVVLAYLGDGATSSEDFHVALNFAGLYHVPVVFLCENNGFAQSVPVARQTAAETLAVKAVAYGLPGIRVDGDDVLAVYAVTHAAAARARAGGGPGLIEAVTSRLAEEPTPERDPRVAGTEGHPAAAGAQDPLERFARYLGARDVLAPADAHRLREELEEELRAALAAEEGAPPPPRESLIEDVYAEPPWHLREQLCRARAGGER